MPLNIPILILSYETIFVSEIGPILYLQELKKNSLSLEDRLNQKWPKIKSIANYTDYGNVAENHDNNIFRIIFVSLEAIQ